MAKKTKTTMPGEIGIGTTGSTGGNDPRGAETVGNDSTGGNDPNGGTTNPTGVGPAGSNDTLFELDEGIKNGLYEAKPLKMHLRLFKIGDVVTISA
jgi:hypothetical protein